MSLNTESEIIISEIIFFLSCFGKDTHQNLSSSRFKSVTFVSDTSVSVIPLCDNDDDDDDDGEKLTERNCSTAFIHIIFFLLIFLEQYF